MIRRRRDVLLGTPATVLAIGSLSTPAIAQGIRELTMVTAWPENSPGIKGAPSDWRGRLLRCRTVGSK